MNAPLILLLSVIFTDFYLNLLIVAARPFKCNRFQIEAPTDVFTRHY